MAQFLDGPVTAPEPFVIRRADGYERKVREFKLRPSSNRMTMTSGAMASAYLALTSRGITGIECTTCT
jgi:hypothetical protein